jgi:hypothetical protein
MLHDAKTTPLGMALSVEAWPRDPRIRQLARARGFTIPSPTTVATDAQPTLALVNHGVWKAWCPDCVGAAEDLWRGRDVFFCMRCGNKAIGGAWRPVTWPENLDAIEARLDPLPVETQNWEPWGDDVDPTEQAAVWSEQVAVMTDPTEGLRDG